MAHKKKSARKKSRSRKKRVVRVRTVVRKVYVAKKSKRRTGASSIASYKKRIRKIAEKDLKDGLFQRDKATSYKQHRTAQSKVDKARRVLRQVSN